MKCLNCGAELTDDTKFCSYCGAKIEQNEEMPSITKPTEQSDAANEYVEFDNSFYSEPTTNGEIKSNKYKEKFLGAWNKLSKFGKVTMIGLSAFVILMLIAFLAGRIVAGIISIVQIAAVIVAILMKKNIIKVTYNWLSLVALALSFVLIIPYFSLFKINSEDYKKYNWDEIVLAEMLPKPESPYGKIISNSEDYLSLYVTKTTEIQYKKYIEACKDKGFTIDAETTGSFFYSFNDKGYELSLSYYDFDSEMHINLDSAMEMETVTWPDSELAKLLPVPKSTTGKIYSNDKDAFSVYIGNTTIDDYNDYVKVCEDKGFTVDEQKKAKTFSAKNADSYKLSVDYKGNNVIYISVAEPEFDVTIEVECVENWIFSKYDVELNVDNDLKGTISHGEKEIFEIVLKRGNHIFSFASADDDTLDGKVEVEITKEETIKLKISCSSSGVNVKILSETTATDNNKNTINNESTKSNDITLTKSNDDFKGMSTNEAEKIFCEMGFAKFEYETVETDDENINDTICYIKITEFIIGKSNFSKGDNFDSESIVTLYSYKYKAPAPVSYSTNNKNTVKNGNTGIYSYKKKSSKNALGGWYDIYYIVDFDDGYVYYFCEGYESEKDIHTSCDKVKITSGDLNSKLIFTYHDGDSSWSECLHFKYKNQPDHLIWQSYSGNEEDFYTTNLKDALNLRDNKTITEY